jgi:hypothetical protein
MFSLWIRINKQFVCFDPKMLPRHNSLVHPRIRGSDLSIVFLSPSNQLNICCCTMARRLYLYNRYAFLSPLPTSRLPPGIATASLLTNQHACPTPSSISTSSLFLFILSFIYLDWVFNLKIREQLSTQCFQRTNPKLQSRAALR